MPRLQVRFLHIRASAMAVEVKSEQAYMGTFRADPNSKGKHGYA